jgi:hypothetical protein
MKKIIMIALLLFLGLTLVACDEEREVEVEVDGPRYTQVRVTTGTLRGSIDVLVGARDQTTRIYYALTLDDGTQLNAIQVQSGQGAITNGNRVGVLSTTILGLDDDTFYRLFIFSTHNDFAAEVFSFPVRTLTELETMIIGTGSIYEPFLISEAWQLAAITTNDFGFHTHSHYRLVADIDLGPWIAEYGDIVVTPDGEEVLDDNGYPIRTWVPIGLQFGNARRLFGGFDGNGHTISNLTVIRTDGNERAGLFREIAEEAYIRDLFIDGVTIETNGSRVGALVGMSRGDISNVHVTNGTITQTGNADAQVGGVVGAFFDEGTLVNASFEGNIVTNGRRVGGVVGTATAAPGNSVMLSDLYFNGTIVSNYRQIGGIVGLLSGAELFNSVAKGIILGAQNVGGIVGMLETGGSVLVPRPRLANVIFIGESVTTHRWNYQNGITDEELGTVGTATQVRAGMIFGNHSTRNNDQTPVDELRGMDIAWETLFVIEDAQRNLVSQGTVIWPSNDPSFPAPELGITPSYGRVDAAFDGFVVTRAQLADSAWYTHLTFILGQRWIIVNGLPQMNIGA